MAPRTILVMRHAEKPVDAGDVHLSPAGQDRARRLVAYVPETFGTPHHLFAAADSKHSHRPVETIAPLAKVLGKTIHADVEDADYEALAKHVLGDAKYAGETLLVCWHHEHIPKLLAALEAPPASCPDPWPDSLFDLIVRLDYDGATPVASEVVEPF